MLELGKYVSFDYNQKSRVGLIVDNPPSTEDDDTIITLDLDVNGDRVTEKTYRSFAIANIDNLQYCRRKKNIQL